MSSEIIHFPDGLSALARFFDELDADGAVLSVSYAIGGLDRNDVVTLGRDEAASWILYRSGYPLHDVSRQSITPDEFSRWVDSLDGPYRQSGLIQSTNETEDIIDGECYLVQWHDSDQAIQLGIFGDPALRSPELQEFIRRLNRLLDRARKPRWLRALLGVFGK